MISLFPSFLYIREPSTLTKKNLYKSALTCFVRLRFSNNAQIGMMPMLLWENRTEHRTGRRPRLRYSDCRDQERRA
jgi:hypothetical protein